MSDASARGSPLPANSGVPAHGYDFPNVSAQSKRQDMEQVRQVLQKWLAARWTQARGIAISDVLRPDVGTSNETLLFRARWAESGRELSNDLVLRIHPSTYQLYKEPAFATQYQLLCALHDSRAKHDGCAVRVPAPVLYEADTRWLGQPFFVMARIEGRTPGSRPPYNASGWLADATVQQRERLWHDAMDQLCRIHRVPAAAAACLDKPQLGPTGFEQERRYWRESLAWAAEGRSVPMLEETLEWLDAHLPAQPLSGLAWGDARIGNMIFNDFEVAGVIDWEQASLGGPLQDLGWWLFFDALHSTAIGLPRLPGLGTRDDTLALWASRTGLEAEGVEWYEIFAGLKLGTILIRKLGMEGGIKPGYNANNNLFTRHLAALRGVAQPSDVEY